VTLTGKLTKPQGDGPFPAVVLMHGCTGIGKHQEDWAARFASWGYVALQVDSLGPRGLADKGGNA
jgi:dienelactone hydrolase